MHKNTQSRERGAVLMEALLAVMITMGIVAFTAGMVSRLVEQRTEKAAARYMEHLHEAVEAYATDERALARHGFTLNTMRRPKDPVSVSLAELRQHGFLPSGFPDRDAYGAGAHIALSVAHAGAHEDAGLMLRIAVFMEGAEGLTQEKAARLNAHARRVRAGHLRAETDEGEVVVVAAFAHGGRMDAEALRAMHGGAPVAGHMMSFYEKPVARSAHPRVVDRGDLVRALEEATNAVAARYENEVWESAGNLANTLFHRNNTGRNMGFREINYRAGGAPAAKAFEIQKHVCPDNYKPTVQLYPKFVSDYDIAREETKKRGARRRVTLAEHRGGPNFRHLFMPQEGHWRAVGIFRTKVSQGDRYKTPAFTEPPNLSRPVYYEPPRDTAESLYTQMTDWRQSSRIHDEADRWVITHLPIFWTRNHADNSASLASFRSTPPGASVFGERGGEFGVCHTLGTCAGVSYDRWFAFRQGGNTFTGINGLEDGCSVMYYRLRAGYPGLPTSSRGSFCQHLKPRDVRVIRKCVPDLRAFKDGLHVILKPPAP